MLPFACLGNAQQPQNEYGLTIINSLAQFRDTANDKELVRITDIRNRSLLIETMKKYGFTVARNEWWHFDFTDNNTYELLDIPSVALEKLAKKRWKKSGRLKSRKT